MRLDCSCFQFAFFVLKLGTCELFYDPPLDQFPDNFQWGAATASYQIEGGWDQDGRGRSIWDDFAQTPNKVDNNDTGNIACDSYNQVEKDVELLAGLKVQFYRFSISWTRLIPEGRKRVVNKKGIDYYNKLINLLISQGIVPTITLYHWDLPSDIQANGGWLKKDIIEDFKFYAKTCFANFGDRVQQWITFNEPQVFVLLGYGSGQHAPGLKETGGTSLYTAGHNVLLAHGQTYRMYRKDFFPKQKGKIFIAHNSGWVEPKNHEIANIAAARRALDFWLGWFAHPVTYGDYPESMKSRVAQRSTAQKLPKSRLPEFTDEEKRMLNGSCDLFGLNHYTSSIGWHCDKDIKEITKGADGEVCEGIDRSWPGSGSGWLKVVPWGLRKVLNHIKEVYSNPSIVITENGVSDRNGTLKDPDRESYFKQYITEMLKAIKFDDVDVIGYTAWSLMDNFEWAEGYSEKFGLVQVDFNDPKRTRTPKDSYKWYAKLIAQNQWLRKYGPLCLTIGVPLD